LGIDLQIQGHDNKGEEIEGVEVVEGVESMLVLVTYGWFWFAYSIITS
jgi:hypothetical protein